MCTDDVCIPNKSTTNGLGFVGIFNNTKLSFLPSLKNVCFFNTPLVSI